MQSFPVFCLSLWWIYNCHFSKTAFTFSQLQLFHHFINLLITKLILLFGSRKKTCLMCKTSVDVTVISRISLWKIILQVTSEMFLEVSIQCTVAIGKKKNRQMCWLDFFIIKHFINKNGQIMIKNGKLILLAFFFMNYHQIIVFKCLDSKYSCSHGKRKQKNFTYVLRIMECFAGQPCHKNNSWSSQIFYTASPRLCWYYCWPAKEL